MGRVELSPGVREKDPRSRNHPDIREHDDGKKPRSETPHVDQRDEASDDRKGEAQAYRRAVSMSISLFERTLPHPYQHSRALESEASANGTVRERLSNSASGP